MSRRVARLEMTPKETKDRQAGVNPGAEARLSGFVVVSRYYGGTREKGWSQQDGGS